jgi:hypothetical protein
VALKSDIFLHYAEIVNGNVELVAAFIFDVQIFGFLFPSREFLQSQVAADAVALVHHVVAGRYLPEPLEAATGLELRERHRALLVQYLLGREYREGTLMRIKPFGERPDEEFGL